MLLLIETQRLTSHTKDLHELKSDQKKKKKILAQRKGRGHKVPPLTKMLFSLVD